MWYILQCFILKSFLFTFHFSAFPSIYNNFLVHLSPRSPKEKKTNTRSVFHLMQTKKYIYIYTHCIYKKNGQTSSIRVSTPQGPAFPQKINHSRTVYAGSLKRICSPERHLSCPRSKVKNAWSNKVEQTRGSNNYHRLFRSGMFPCTFRSAVLPEGINKI